MTSGTAGGGLGSSGGLQAKVIEDLLARYLVVQICNDLELAAALPTCEGIGMKDLRDEANPVAEQRHFLAGASSTLPSAGTSGERSPRDRFA
jgi:hypothetical protein